jgi:2-polyprenyl-3-methyl-5-hydroxy-6-metoxy-1,4-benzoquinol methylase
MSDGVQEFRRLWEESGVDRENPTSVTAFYRDQFTEAYELAEWDCGRVHGTPPLGYARAALFARSRGLRRVLDFGSGIGTGSLCLARAGCEVHSADVARRLLKLVEHRMRRRSYRPQLIDLEAAAPPEGYFDLITCFDVLEHVPDQFATLRRLESYLRVGGYLFINLMTDSSDHDRPMHISSAGNWLRLVRRTSLTPEWASFSGAAQVFARKRGGQLRNFAASWIDRLQGY